MSSNFSAFAAVVFAVLLVTAGVGNVSATHSSDCSEMDGAISFISLGILGDGSIMENTACASHTLDSVTSVTESEDQQTKLDIRSAAFGVKSSAEVSMASYDNYLNDSKSAAWMKAQVAVAEAYQNDSSQSQARVAAKTAIQDYYLTKQINLLEHYNNQLYQYHLLQERAANESGVPADYVHGYSKWENTDKNRTFDLGSESVTLLDGSSYTIHTVTTSAYEPGSLTGWANIRSVGVKSHDDFEHVGLLYFQDYQDRWNRIQAINSDLQPEASNFVDSTYADFESGEINASDVISANTAMFEYGTAYNESGSLYDSVGALAMMGYDTPNLNDSGTMTVSYNGQNYTGVVMARNAPGGSWVTNTTYNTSNISGPVFIATTEGTKVDFAGGETFTVVGMTSTEGSQIDQVQTTKYVYKTANTSQLHEMQNRIAELQDELEARQKSVGGESGSDGSIPVEAIGIGLLAVAAVAVLSSREQNSGSGGGPW